MKIIQKLSRKHVIIIHAYTLMDFTFKRLISLKYKHKEPRYILLETYKRLKYQDKVELMRITEDLITLRDNRNYNINSIERLKNTILELNTDNTNKLYCFACIFKENKEKSLTKRALIRVRNIQDYKNDKESTNHE